MFQPSCITQRFNFNLRRAKLGTGSLKLGGGIFPRLGLASTSKIEPSSAGPTQISYLGYLTGCSLFNVGVMLKMSLILEVGEVEVKEVALKDEKLEVQEKTEQDDEG